MAQRRHVGAVAEARVGAKSLRTREERRGVEEGSHHSRPHRKWSFLVGDAALTYHRLQARPGQHELHLLSQHGRRRLLLDEVVAPVDLQLGFQMRRRVQVLAVLSRTPTL